MSKFWFFDRKGRPTTNEKRICDTFNSLIDDGVVSNNQVEEYLDEYGKPMNESELEEMFGFLTGNDSNGKKYEYANDNDDSDDSDDVDYDDSNDVDYQEVDSSTNSANNNSVDFNPFEEPVIERSYTKGFQPKSKDGDDDDSDSDDDNENDNDSEKGFSDDDLKMPSDGESIVEGEEDEDIPEPEWASAGGFSGGSDDEEGEDYDDEDDEDNDKLGGDNLQDLTPAQKRKSAEKTADALLGMYAQFIPMPFIKISSFNEGKIQKMVFNNQLDLSMQLENNVTVKDYIDGVNEQAQEVFKVSEETKEEIKDPLIDVLLEQDLALTPTQRLMFAIGGHILTMGFSAYQLNQNNKQALETFEKFHNQMNKQKAPVYQGGGKVPKNKPRQRPEENLSRVEKQSVEELMRQMKGSSSDDDDDDDDDDDIIDAEHDPRVEVSEDYGDDD